MASGGRLGNVLSAPFSLVSNLFSAGSSSTGIESSAYPSVTAYDLVPKTESTQPDSPVMGDSSTNYTNKKKRGLSSLYVDSGTSNTSSSSDYTGRSGL